MRYIVVFTLFLGYVCMYGQTIEGRVIDSNTNLPISYVSIGIINKNGGVYANEQGYFQIHIQKYEKSDSLRFSCIGYKPYSVLIDDVLKLDKQIEVGLNLQILDLHEIIIQPKEKKIIKLGNRFSIDKICLCAGNNDIESGIVISNSKKLILSKFSFDLSQEYIFPDSVLMRFNIFDVNEGLPTESKLKKPIYFTSYRNQDKVEIDIEKYKILVEDTFAATIEIIKKYGDGKVCYAGWLNGNLTIWKFGKQGKWLYPTDDKKRKRRMYQSLAIDGFVEK